MKADGPYFEYESSIHSTGKNIENVLRTVSRRYMASNPKKPLQMRAFYEKGFLQDFSGCFLFDFDEKFPQAKPGEYAYAFSYAYSIKEYKALMSFKTRSPAWVYLNGELIFKTEPEDEGLGKAKIQNVHFKKGRNVFFIRCRKNSLGFGCEFGDGYVRGNAMNFVNPTAEHYGKSGWAYTRPVSEDIFDSSESFPEIGVLCGDTWLPGKDLKKQLSISDVLGNEDGYAYGLAFFENTGFERAYKFLGSSYQPCKIYTDGELCFEGSGKIEIEVVLKTGMHEILVETRSAKEYGFTINLDEEFVTDSIVSGLNGKWLYIGMFEKPCSELLSGFDRTKIFEGKNGKLYWKTDEEDTSVRLSLESDLFGKWNYPIGVVLYGLYAAGTAFGDSPEYAEAHMRVCAESYEYADWDTKKFGRASLDHQLMEMDALDFCGSCGSAMLEVLGYEGNAKNIADMIADYMENHQERLDNGMFYRAKPGKIQENTIWADDLYMSVPFLCRYYKNTGDEKYLNDAVNQIECFKEYLYMPEKRIMSHVYNLNYGKKNEIPWGRGNGWTVFALSELLGVMPEGHSKRKTLLNFYRELYTGYLSYQDENGMWRQVLDEADAYQECSATAMFICAFARGIRNGWLTEEKFMKAAYRGWEALCKYCIDYNGNIYGVCIGSSLSFRRDYYMNELTWNINDTHGTGIVLLAGTEILKMSKEV